jgi:hypothetical protein
LLDNTTTTTTTLNTCCLISCEAFKPSYFHCSIIAQVNSWWYLVVKVHLPKGTTYLPFNLVRTCKGTTTRLNLGSCARWSAYFWFSSYFCRPHRLFRKDLGCIWVIRVSFRFSSEHIVHRSGRIWTAEVAAQLHAHQGQEAAETTCLECLTRAGHPVWSGAEPEQEDPEVDKLCQRAG